ncbi:MAG: lysophospholipid acyltransferase family protein [Actinomycetes bacterium]
MAAINRTEYERLVAVGRSLLPEVRIGRPGRARTYWLTIGAMRVLRLRWRVRVEGDKSVLPGAAILVGNHVSAMDPVATVMSHWWRVTAFTKVEVYQKRGAIFFRLMGQIPLRRGDEVVTEWALTMAGVTLADGNKVGIYPEGTRSPDPRRLHRLHPRILIPLVRAHPDVPVHAIHTEYSDGRFRHDVAVRLSSRLALDPDSSDEDMIRVIREALLALGGQEYTDESAASVKKRAAGQQG